MFRQIHIHECGDLLPERGTAFQLGIDLCFEIGIILHFGIIFEFFFQFRKLCAEEIFVTGIFADPQTIIFHPGKIHIVLREKDIQCIVKRGDLRTDCHGIAAGFQQQAPSAGRIEQPVEEEPHRTVGNMDPQMIGGIIFQRVGFIEDHGTVNGQRAFFLMFDLPDLEIGEKQCMIGHNHIGTVPHLPVFPIKTPVEIRTFRPPAAGGFATDTLPQCAIHPEGDLRTAAGFCLGCPLPQFRQIFSHIRIRQDRCRKFPGCQSQTPFAQIVGAAFCEDKCKIQSHQIFEKRQVFIDQLFLKSDGFCCDQYRCFCGAGMIDRRNKIRKTFSHTGGCFHAQIVIAFQGFCHGFCHFTLLDSFFIGSAAEFFRTLQWRVVRKKFFRPHKRIAHDQLRFLIGIYRFDHGWIPPGTNSKTA